MPGAWRHASTAVDGDNAYFAGGWLNPNDREYDENDTILDDESTLCRYNVTADEWHTDVPPLPEAGGAGAMVRVERNLHFLGGHEVRLDAHVDTGSHWVLSLDDLASGWSPLAPMPNPRNHLGAAVPEGAIYAIGGQTLYEVDAVAQADVDECDPATNVWTQVASLALPLSHNSATTFPVGDQILVLGAEDAHNDYANTVFAYDPVENAWTRLDELPDARNAAVGGAIDGKLYFSGGWMVSTKTLEGSP